MSQAGRALHLVNKNQFLDSPEWFGVTTDEYFQVEYFKANASLSNVFPQVSVTALEPCTLLTWHRDRVKFCLMEDAKLQAIFDHVVGRRSPAHSVPNLRSERTSTENTFW